jgi:hypothetical protein
MSGDREEVAQRLRRFTVTSDPVDCPHTRSGQGHRSLRQIARCAGRYGYPKLRYQEEGP